MELGEQPLIARAEEYVFACPPILVVVGRVIDAETKQPIESFQVVPGVRSNPQRMNWVPNQIFEAKTEPLNIVKLTITLLIYLKFKREVTCQSNREISRAMKGA